MMHEISLTITATYDSTPFKHATKRKSCYVKLLLKNVIINCKAHSTSFSKILLKVLKALQYAGFDWNLTDFTMHSVHTRLQSSFNGRIHVTRNSLLKCYNCYCKNVTSPLRTCFWKSQSNKNVQLLSRAFTDANM